MNPFTRTSVELPSLFAQGMVNILLQSTALILAGLIAARLFRHYGSAVQSAICRGTLVAVLICPLASLALSGMGIAGWTIRLPAIVAVNGPAEAAPPSVPLNRSPEERDRIVERANGPGDNPAAFMSIENATDSPDSFHSEIALAAKQPGPAAPGAAVGGFNASPTVEAQSDVFRGHLLIVVYRSLATVWIIGAMLMLARLWVAYRKMRKLRGQSVLADENELAICSDLAARIRVASPQVLRNPQLSSPCLAGVSSPAILLPAGIQERFLLEKAFAHELAHLRRNDNLWNLAQRVSLALFFFQPLIWWLVRRLETTAEEVCDDCVVSHCADRTGYAQQLVELAESRHSVPGLAGIGMFQCKSVLGHRIVRILDSTRQLTTGVSRSVIAGIGAAAIGCAILGGLVGSGNNPFSTGLGQESDAAEVSAGKTINFSGRVLNSTGQPVSNADISVVPLGVTTRGESEILSYATLKSAADGSFEVSFPLSEMRNSNFSLDREKNFNIVASAPGHGLNWIGGWDLEPAVSESGNHIYNSIDLELTEAKNSVELRLIDAEGNPVSQARVVVESVIRFPSEDLNPFYKAIEEGHSLGGLFGGSRYANNLSTHEYLSDDTGAVKIDGLGDNRIVELKFTGPAIAVQMASFVTVDTKPVTVRSGAMVGDSRTFYGAKSTITCEPTQPVVGRIVDAETGHALPGVSVYSNKFAGGKIGGLHWLKAVSDSDGRFELPGMPRGNGNEIVVVPNDDQPYFMMRYEVPNQNGLDPVEMEIGLPRGVWIEGKVTDATTREPVVGARVFYMPFTSSEHARKSPAFANNQYLVIQDRYLTGPDGFFRTVGLPGRAVLGIQTTQVDYPSGMGWEHIDDSEKSPDGTGQVDTYNRPITPSRLWPNAMKQIDVSLSEASHRVDFALDRGLSVPLQIVDNHNEPVTGVSITGLRSSRDYNYISTESHLLAGGFARGEKRELIFHYTEKHLSAVIRLDGPAQDGDGQTASPVLVKLMPDATVSGRVVNAAGDPVAGQHVVFGVGESRDFSHRLRPVSTDKNGRFEIDTVHPGTFYRIHIETPDDLYSIAKHLDVAPGEHIDLGVIDISTKERPEPKRRSIGAASDDPSKPVDEMVTFTGTVVDLAGKPVGNATVSLRDFNALSDANGLFKLDVSKAMIDAMPGARLSLHADKQGYGRCIVAATVDQRENLRLELADDIHPIVGKIIDSEGNPVEGATVEVGHIQIFSGADLAGLLSAPPNDSKRGWLPRGIATIDERIQPVKSLADGTFAIHGIGAGRIADLSVTGDYIALQKVVVATVDVEPVGYETGASMQHLGKAVIHGCKLTIVAEPTQPIEGVVIDRDTRQPLPGVEVMSDGFLNTGREGFHGVHDLKTRTDENGRFRLTGMPKGNGNSIMVGTPRDGLLEVPVIAQRFDVVEAAGLDPIEMELAVQRGVWIRGKAVDAETGEPVPWANVQYRPYISNEIATKLRPDQELDETGWGPETDTEGNFQVIAFPGPAAIGLLVHDPNYPAGQGWENIPAELKAKASEKAPEVIAVAFPANLNANTIENPPNVFVGRNLNGRWTCLQSIDAPASGMDDVILKVGRGVAVKITTIDEAGLPVSGVDVNHARTFREKTRRFNTAEFELGGFLPGQKRIAMFQQTERKLGAIAEVNADEDLAEQITLERMSRVTARLVDSQGQPVRGRSLKFGIKDGNGMSMFNFQKDEVSDADGRISQWLIPGSYLVSIDIQGFSGQHKLAVGSGELIELGDIDVNRKLAVQIMRSAGEDYREDYREEIPGFEAKRSKLMPESIPGAVK